RSATRRNYSPQRHREHREARTIPLCASVVNSLNRKGVAAAAGRGGVWVLDLKRGAHQILDKIDLGPVQQFERHVIDNHPDAAVLEHDIVGTGLLVKAQPVLKARAAAARHRNAKKGPLSSLLRLEGGDPPCRAVGNRDPALAGNV